MSQRKTTSRTLTEKEKEALGARLHKAKRQKAEARAKAEAKARRRSLEREAATIDGRIAKASQAYEEAFTRAMRAPLKDIDKAFTLADHRQGQLINLLARKQRLKAELK